MRRSPRARIAALCAGVLAVAFYFRAPSSSARSLETALARSLAHRGFALARSQVVWLAHGEGPLALRPLLFVAKHGGELEEVYYAEARVSAGSGDRDDDSAVLDLFWLTNLTNSSSAAEGSLIRSGDHVAFTVQVGGSTEALVVLDTRGEPARLTQSWPAYARAQNAITNLQETGRLRGFGQRRYQLEPSSGARTLRVDHGRFVAESAQGDGVPAIVIDPDKPAPIAGAELVTVQVLEKGRPGTITWLVDTVRNLSFVGPAPIEWLEHKVFGVTDFMQRAYHEYAGEPSRQRAEIREALAVPVLAPEEQKELLTATDPELGWPPAPLRPVLADPVSGEGEWLPVVDEAFVNAYPNAPPAFYQTFLRVDAERPYVSAYVTVWDPRQVQLHLTMGTKEPQSATGETGTGLIPRDPKLLDRLVGAFNGGFQALHGEFGMMAEGRVYLPPKPWAGTVAIFDDGRVGMGSWPGPGRSGWDEERANAQIPPDMIAMRQNLTSVVEDGQYNPWKRWWWGAAPEFADEQTYIARSGLCVTQEGHMAFLWGESMGPEELGKVMLALRCARGIHLDMNSKHTGFEFYKPLRPGAHAPPLGRALTEQEYEGPIEQGLGYALRARLAVKTMTPLRFPRYVGRDPRDFFFLTLKPVLPGPPLALPDGSRVAFSAAGLPHAGWPHAFARARLPEPAPEPKRSAGRWLVRIDTRRAIPERLAPAELDHPLARLTGVEPGGEGPLALYAVRERGVWRYGIGTPAGPDALVLLRGELLSPEHPATSALAIDSEGFLLYAEADNPKAPFTTLTDSGAPVAIALPSAARLAFTVDDRSVSVDGQREIQAEGGLRFMSEVRPAAAVMFPEVEPMPYQRWGFLQGQRVRYFPSGPPRFRTPEDVLEAMELGPKDAGPPKEPTADPKEPTAE